MLACFALRARQQKVGITCYVFRPQSRASHRYGYGQILPASQAWRHALHTCMCAPEGRHLCSKRPHTVHIFSQLLSIKDRTGWSKCPVWSERVSSTVHVGCVGRRMLAAIRLLYLVSCPKGSVTNVALLNSGASIYCGSGLCRTGYLGSTNNSHNAVHSIS